MTECSDNPFSSLCLCASVANKYSLQVNLESAAARRLQVNEFPVVFERALSVNDEVRVPLAQCEGRRVPGAAEVCVRQSAFDEEGGDPVNVGRFQPVRRRDADDSLRRCERREDL